MKSESKTFVLKSILLILPNSFNFWIKKSAQADGTHIFVGN